MLNRKECVAEMAIWRHVQATCRHDNYMATSGLHVYNAGIHGRIIMNQEHDDTTQIDETPAEPQALPTDKADVSVDPQRAKKIVDCHMSEWKRECIKRDAERQEIWDAGQAARDKAAALRLQPPDDLFQAP